MRSKEAALKYQREWVRARRNEWLEKNGPCGRCGTWKRLEVDHINPSDKVTHKVWSLSKERREEELKKCQVLCYSCHKLKTRRERVRPFCKYGHPYVVDKLGHSICRICKRKAKQLSRLRKKMELQPLLPLPWG